MGTFLIPLRPTTDFRTLVRLHVIVSRAAGLRAEPELVHRPCEQIFIIPHGADTAASRKPKGYEVWVPFQPLEDYIDPVATTSRGRWLVKPLSCIAWRHCESQF